MKVTVNDYTFKEFYEFQKMHYKSSDSKWIFSLLGIIILSMGLLSILRGVISIGAILQVIISLGLLFYSQTYLRYHASVLFKKSKNQYSESRHFEFNEEGVKVEMKYATSTLRWQAIRKYLYNEDVLVLYTTVLSALMIPRRSLESDKEWDELINLVKTHLHSISA